MDEFFFPAKNKERCASSKSRYLCRKKVPLFNSVKETGLFSRDFFYIYLLMDTDSQAFMTICEGNQQPIHKEKF